MLKPVVVFSHNHTMIPLAIIIFKSKVRPNPPDWAGEEYQSHPGCRGRGPVPTDDDLRLENCQLDLHCFDHYKISYRLIEVILSGDFSREWG